jgi:hypothetical protein
MYAAEERYMQVNVFVARESGRLQEALLILPMVPRAPIPKDYRVGWRYFATTDTDDALFGEIDARAIEVELENSGFALVSPKAPGRK